MNGYSEKPGLWGSATQPKTRQMLVCQQLCFLSLLQEIHVVSFKSQQPELQKLVPKCQKLPTEHRSDYTSPVQSCWLSIFSPPRANLTIWYNFTPPMHSSLPTTNHKNDGERERKKTTKKENRERCQGFDKSLLSVLSQFKAIIKFH